MNEFETLDDDLSDKGINANIRSLGGSIGQWAKIIAVINIAIQTINVITSLIYFGISGFGSLIGVGISIALYVTLLKFGQSMSTFSDEGNYSSLEMAMVKQRVYWQFIGILMIVALLFELIIIVAFGSDIYRVFDFFLYNI